MNTTEFLETPIGYITCNLVMILLLFLFVILRHKYLSWKDSRRFRKQLERLFEKQRQQNEQMMKKMIVAASLPIFLAVYKKYKQKKEQDGIKENV